MNSRNKTGIVEHKLALFATHSFVDSSNSQTPRVEIHTRPKLSHFGRYVVNQSEAILLNFHPGYRDLGRTNQGLN